MKSQTKILIAGVGGQGVMYITDLLVEAALLADIPVATSEIHGLAQRGGTVTASLGFGTHCSGFIEKGGADFLLALEALEAQRCLPYLHKKSRAVIDGQQMLPYSVNTEADFYPEASDFVEYLGTQLKEVILLESAQVPYVLRNIYVLGKAARMANFPVPGKFIEQAIQKKATDSYREDSIKIFSLN